MRLHPFAVEVFTCIFHEFLTPSAFSQVGVAAMNLQDFVLYLKRKGSVTTEQAEHRAHAVFAKYGAPPRHAQSLSSSSSSPSSGQSQSSSLFSLSAVGDECSHLLLDGFLQFTSDSAVESSRRVLKELRFLESRHAFNNTHHAALLLLPDLRVAFASLLSSLFRQEAAAALDKARTPPLPHGLLTRTLEEEVNVRPGVPSSLRDAAVPVGSGGDSAIDPSAVMKLMNSHERWRAQPRRRDALLFLLAFVEHRAISIPSHFPSVSSFALLQRADDASGERGAGRTAALSASGSVADVFSDVHSAARLSELFQRSMREMGGGYGHAALSSSSAGSSSVDPFYVEKAYAAAVIKHNGLVDACLHYARSVELWRLLANAATKGTRCLYQSSCPEWWSRVVQSVMDHVRQPIALLIRERRERDEEQRTKDQDERARANYDRERERERERDTQREAVEHMRALDRHQQRHSPGTPGLLTRDTASSTDEAVALDAIEEVERERAEQSQKAGQDTSLANGPSSLPSIPSISLSPSSSQRSAEHSSSALSPDSPLDLVQSPVLGPSLGGLSLDDADPSDSLDPAVLRMMNLMAANALFLVHDLRAAAAMAGASPSGSAAGSRAGSKAASPRMRASAQHVSAGERRRSEGGELSTKLSVHQALDGWSAVQHSGGALSFDTDDDGDGGADVDADAADDADCDDDDDDAQADRVRSLLLQRTQSDRFGSPLRQSSSPHLHPMALWSSNSPNAPPRVSLSPPPLLMSAYGRRSSESDAAHNAAADGGMREPAPARDQAAVFSATTSILTAPQPAHSALRDVNALSSWTGASLDPLYSSSAAAALEGAGVPPASSFDDAWIAALVRSPMSLTSSLSSSIAALQTALLSRVDLLTLLNESFRAGHTTQLVDDVLSIIQQAHVVSDIQTSSSLRSRNPHTEDGLLFFYKHLGQTLTRQRFTHGDRAAWSRLRVILLFLSVRFGEDDVDHRPGQRHAVRAGALHPAGGARPQLCGTRPLIRTLPPRARGQLQRPVILLQLGGRAG